ncbi:hypothetical protein CEXT_800271 [Caerostris extrusa]|uniref:Uncharacterized protein n=1 Tax=Caerostris extrusa TaxID=172846 RepID=A0AAV4XPY4_CAEEX|nr:hypothetical protein CEXT_800271 [Caerostris extrusa]
MVTRPACFNLSLAFRPNMKLGDAAEGSFLEVCPYQGVVELFYNFVVWYPFLLCFYVWRINGDTCIANEAVDGGISVPNLESRWEVSGMFEMQEGRVHCPTFIRLIVGEWYHLGF